MSPASPPPPDDSADREILFEFTRVGDQVKVCAIDSATGAEAAAFGPANAAQADLERLALNKLRYVLRGREAAETPSAGGRPGKLV